MCVFANVVTIIVCVEIGGKMVRLDGPLPALRETLPGLHKFCESKFYTVAPNVFSIIVRLFPCTQKLCIGSRAPSGKCLITGSQVTPEFWVLSMELASCHPFGTYNFDVASKFLE
jgi:hypothetical protein